MYPGTAFARHGKALPRDTRWFMIWLDALFNPGKDFGWLAINCVVEEPSGIAGHALVKHFPCPRLAGIICGRVNEIPKVNTFLVRPEKDKVVTGSFPLFFLCHIVDFLQPLSCKGTAAVTMVLQNTFPGGLQSANPTLGVKAAVRLSYSIDGKEQAKKNKRKAGVYFHREQLSIPE